ncbi:DUF4240 domain-containing protein [Streptomyces sp. NPDC056452]|uniref:DUF4240 domain-containing protein n=1 Tax=Streptomyces sp. NPDC056452 TaxID=3345821 RepID=UPI0036AD749F
MGGGCSDDSFTDFRAGLIGLGREWYERAAACPDVLAEHPAMTAALRRRTSTRSYSARPSTMRPVTPSSVSRAMEWISTRRGTSAALHVPVPMKPP